MKLVNYHQVKAEPVTEEGAKDTTIAWALSERDGVPNFSMRIFRIQPGGYTPLHSHSWEHEVFVIGGEGILVDEGKEHRLKAGDIALVSPQEQHHFKNDGDQTWEFLCLVPNDRR
jgi:quercetin dioxygenase-like cupin family protein